MLIAYRMKFAVLWAQVYELRVYSFIYLQCLCCNEYKIMTPFYISARQTGHNLPRVMMLLGVIETRSVIAYNGDHTELLKQKIDHLTMSSAQDVKQC